MQLLPASLAYTHALVLTTVIYAVITDPFHLLLQRQPIRVNYKVLQLLQSRCKGKSADTDLEHTEI